MTHHCEECDRYIEEDVDECPACGAELDIPDETDDGASTAGAATSDRDPKSIKAYASIGVRVVIAQIVVGIILLVPNLMMRPLIRSMARQYGQIGAVAALVTVVLFLGIALIVQGAVVYRLYGWE
jgi:uncharacterized membrane protein YvbJ